MTIYLYVKTHRKTGLKYLGKTKKDPFVYQGSGVHWKNHLKKHGYDIETEILRECQSNEELKEWGLHYSRLWNVVDSKEWANIVPEEGTGGDTSMSPKHILAMQTKDVTGQKNPMSKPGVKERHRVSMSESWSDPDKKAYRLSRSHTEELNKQRSEALKKIWEDPILREEWSKKYSGKNNPACDLTIYHWVHDDGTEEQCSRYDLYTKYQLKDNKVGLVARGIRKSHKGWRIKSDVSHA